MLVSAALLAACGSGTVSGRLPAAQYTKDGSPDDTATSAGNKAMQICDARQSSIRFSGNYRRSSLGTTYVWPTGLSSLGPVDTYLTDISWESAQVICLVRRSNNQPVRQRILR